MMKFGMRILILCVIILLTSACAVLAVGEEKALTVMVYMCGSNLESVYGSAGDDIHEMQTSGLDTDKINLIVMSGGAKRWSTGQDVGKLRISVARGAQMVNMLEWPRRSMGNPDTLTEFIAWGVERCPAKKYALILWDHGAGPLEGICLDELNEPDRLSIAELVRALEASPLPGKLSWVGFDACLMSTAEVAMAMSPWAEYMIASQDTEPAEGWDYSFLKGVEADADGAATGRRIVDAYFESQREQPAGLTLACLDLSRLDAVVAAMDDFFGALDMQIDDSVFAEWSNLRTETASFGEVVRGITSDGFDLVDLGDLADHYGNLANPDALRRAVADAVVYNRVGDGNANGLSVYHPLRNKAAFLEQWREGYAALDFCPGYQSYLDNFGALLTGEDKVDWSGLRLSDDGFGGHGENRYSLRLTPEQRANFASAQLLIMGDCQAGQRARLSEADGAAALFPVSTVETAMDPDGLLTADYLGRSLYLVDGEGRTVAGPVAYSLSDDGRYWYIRVSYSDNSGRADAAPAIRVLYTCRSAETAGELDIVKAEVYDPVTDTYTRRIGFSEADYTDMWIDPMARSLPEGEGALPGVDAWETADVPHVHIALPLNWRLQLFDEQLSGTLLYAVLQVTDVRQRTYCAPPVEIRNPNLYDINVLPKTIRGDCFELTLHVVRNTSQLDRGLTIGVELRNTSQFPQSYGLTDMVLNHTRSLGQGLVAEEEDGPVRTIGWVTLALRRKALGIDPGIDYLLRFDNVQPGETVRDIIQVDQASLVGLGKISALSMKVVLNRFHKTPTTDVNCRLVDCDVAGLGTDLDAVLCQDARKNVLWQLVALDKSAAGGLTGLLRVVNHSDSALSGRYKVIVNECLQLSEDIEVGVSPDTDACVRFTLSNSIVGDIANVGLAGSRANDGSLYCNHLMEQCGILQVESLRLCDRNPDSATEDVLFRLDEPMPLTSAAIADSIRGFFGGDAPKNLLDGDITVSLDRVQVRDSDIILRLRMQNHLNRSTALEISHVAARIGGYAYAAKPYALTLGANAAAYDSLILRDVAGLEKLGGDAVGTLWFGESAAGSSGMPAPALSDVMLAFRVNGLATDWAVIHLDVPVECGTREAVNRLTGDFSVTEARAVRAARERYTAEVPDDGDRSLIPSLEVEDDDELLAAVEWAKPMPSTLKLFLRLDRDSQSEEKLRIETKELRLNDVRSVEIGDGGFDLNPGESLCEEMPLTDLDLVNLKALTAVGCTLVVRARDGASSPRRIPLRFELPACPVNGRSFGAALAETGKEHVTWRLLSLECAEDWLGLRMDGVIGLQNGGDLPCEAALNTFLVNDAEYYCDYRVQVPANADICLGFSLYLDPLPFLLDSEVEAIQSICLSPDNFLEKGSGAAGVRLSLAEAWPLTGPEGPRTLLPEARSNLPPTVACIGRDHYYTGLLFDLLDEAPPGVYIDDGGRLQEELDQVSKELKDKELKDIRLQIGFDIDQSKIILD